MATQHTPEHKNTRYIFWFFGLFAVVQGGFGSYLLTFLKPHLASQAIPVEQIAFNRRPALCAYCRESTFWPSG